MLLGGGSCPSTSAEASRVPSVELICNGGVGAAFFGLRWGSALCKEGWELVLWHTGRNWGGREGWDVYPKRPGSPLGGGEGELGEPRGAGRKEPCSVRVAEPREGRARLRTPFLQ